MDDKTRKRIKEIVAGTRCWQRRRQAIRDALEAPVLEVMDKHPNLDEWKVIAETLEALHQAVAERVFTREKDEKKRKER